MQLQRCCDDANNNSNTVTAAACCHGSGQISLEEWFYV